MGKPPWLLGTFSHRWSDQKIKEQLLAYVGYTQLCNTAGVPAMSVPLHWSSSGLPIGVQFIAPFAQEHRLFSLAGQLERAEPWSGKIPQGL
jgi:Asp-tRNA(Asn)/Glu-tRNA(Gln) amidotransferase A subunit family amidase